MGLGFSGLGLGFSGLGLGLGFSGSGFSGFSGSVGLSSFRVRSTPAESHRLMTAPTGKPANFCSLSGVSPMAMLPPAVASMVTLPSMVISDFTSVAPSATLPLPMAAAPARGASSLFRTPPPVAVMLGEPASVLLMETLFLVSSVSGSVSAPPPIPAAPAPPCAFSMVTLPSMVTSPVPRAPPPIPAPSSPPAALPI